MSSKTVVAIVFLLAIGSFIFGYFAEYPVVMIIGGCFLVFFDVMGILTGMLKLFPAVILAAIFISFFDIWYVGLFWSCAVFQAISIPFAFAAIFNPKGEQHDDEELFLERYSELVRPIESSYGQSMYFDSDHDDGTGSPYLDQQIVGQNCAVCGERISKELNVMICPGCGKALHNDCRDSHDCDVPAVTQGNDNYDKLFVLKKYEICDRAEELSNKAIKDSFDYLMSLCDPGADELARIIEPYTLLGLEKIEHERTSTLFENFLDAELDFHTPGDRGIGRMTTIIPRLGSYMRSYLEKMNQQDIEEFRSHLRPIMWCGYFAYIVTFEGKKPKPILSFSEDELYEKWIEASYRGDMAASDNHYNIVSGVTAKACQGVFKWLKEKNVPIDTPSEDNRTGELILWYAFVACKLRAVEIGQWK